jgi:hypothetical protein
MNGLPLGLERVSVAVVCHLAAFAHDTTARVSWRHSQGHGEKINSAGCYPICCITSRARLRSFSA